MTTAPPKTAIVTTLRDAENILDSFLYYHRRIGFDHHFLFFDDPDDPSIETALRYPHVTVIRNDDALHRIWKTMRTYGEYGPFTDVEIMARQVLNTEYAIALAREKQIDWLLHIDSDELFYSPHETVQEHFGRLSRKKIKQYYYTNYEAISETEDVTNFFKEITLFKKHPFFLNRAQRRLRKSYKGKEPNIHFIAYQNGKTAGRVSPTLLPVGVHLFATPLHPRWGKLNHLPIRIHLTLDYLKKNALTEPRDPIILHYPSCGFEAFWIKYQTLGDFPDTWWDRDEIIKFVPFDIQARDTVMTGDRDLARDFYRRMCVFSDADTVSRLISEGLICRIAEPARMLEAVTSEAR